MTYPVSASTQHPNISTSDNRPVVRGNDKDIIEIAVPLIVLIGSLFLLLTYSWSTPVGIFLGLLAARCVYLIGTKSDTTSNRI